MTESIDVKQTDKANKAPNEPRQSGISTSEKHSEKLVRIVLESGAVLFHDESKEPHIALPLPDGRKNYSLDLRTCERPLRHLAFSKNFVPGTEALNTALQQLASIACFRGPQHPLYIRMATCDGDFWLDLGNTKAVRIMPGNWEIVSDPPILFRSFPDQLPIPDPVKGGDPWQVLKFMNLPDRDSELLMMCLLGTSLVPGISNPILVLHGVEGSAKSTTMEVMKNLLDPTNVCLHHGVPDQREFFLAASHNRILFYNNETKLPEWLSNALCIAVDGGAMSGRLYFTNTQLYVLKFKPIVGVNGIPLVAELPDLIDRSLIFELNRIKSDRSIEPEEFWRDFEIAQPSILGGLLDVVAQARLIYPSLKPRKLKRMASFRRWGAAVAKALGTDPGEFLSAYDRNRARQKEYAIEANPFALTIMEFIGEGRTEWQGIMSQLLKELKSIAVNMGIDLRDAAWPKSPNKASRELTKVKEILRANGIEVMKTRTGGQRQIILRKIAPDLTKDSTWESTSDDADSANDDTQKSIVTLESASILENDDSDDNDDRFHILSEGSAENLDDAPVSTGAVDGYDDIRHLMTTDLGKSQDYEYGW